MLDYPSMRAVALVAQTGSFEKAAQVLCVTPSAVSQRIKQLEERLGVVLIVRGNPCVATEKGEWLCRHMDHVGMLESELFQQLPALAEAGAAQERVTLNIATNADSLGTWFLDAVSKFTGGSDYLVNIAVDDQDHTVEWLRGGRVLAAVTAHAKPVQGCRVLPLGVLRYHATASPDFMARHFAGGVTPAALARAPGLTFNQKDRLQASWVRKVLGEDIAYPTHWLPSTDGFVKASLSGMGWGLNPVQLVGDHLKTGRLVEVVPGTPLDIPLYWQVNRLAAERLGVLTSHVVETARGVLLR
ncbi:LysR family transcriptional regulator ArgP [Agrobacterium tumefaciens]|uniref:LysR family transcriptional regulator, chromosome initiation inhibitor n=1 Tax=Agrobacterium tumefaciens TaxID=358 RepID=A0A2L2L9N6_AGRTU|nr:LysR family transcriptional regulator ArgP [Agrobacterium tumefaciens]AVH41029.1 LysR family transcriptional regulator, chromosome initiation inhibitor [Agrobacterium tumefaciens]NSY94972.1 LysR family transcriptional regulator ArgP [Agrobacterium tumefaciens]NSZ01839.1 LysR family transcriptional regulator ArgP [Agrobacterium tumefaciens]NSZ38774.1 LysR family transcriptional regulator ArgP [Agrobacterium tumefaciens]NTB01489.1 LysR family transcriptional regulator ArgP [Agrobacterium tume